MINCEIHLTESTNILIYRIYSQILEKKSNEENGVVHGICGDSFVKHVFPKYPDLGHRLFAYLHMSSKAQTKHMGSIAFRQQCERFLGILDDSVILENYVKMFCEPDRSDSITPDGLNSLLRTCFQLAMAHYTDGAHTYCPLVRISLLDRYTFKMNY